MSVRDILDVVGGAPGMFYYYFKSKQEIYIATMEQYIMERLEKKCGVIENPQIPFEEKLQVFRSMVAEDIHGYMERFDPKIDVSISDSSYKLWDLVHMLNRMVQPYTKLILQGIRDGKISNHFGITEENADMYATFILFGCWGTVYNSRFTENENQYELQDVLEITDKIFNYS